MMSERGISEIRPPPPSQKAPLKNFLQKIFWVYSRQFVDAGGRQSILQRTTNHEWRTP